MKKILTITIMFLMFSCTMLDKKTNERSFHSKPGFPHVHLSLTNSERGNILIYSLDGVERKVSLEKISDNEFFAQDIKVNITKGGDLILNIKDKAPIEFFEIYENDKENFNHKEENCHHGHTH